MVLAAEHLIIANDLGRLSQLALPYKSVKASKLTMYVIIQNKIMSDVGTDLLQCPSFGGPQRSLLHCRINTDVYF